MTGLEEIEKELSRAREAELAGQGGRARTAARRAVGIAIEEVQRRHPARFSGTTAPAQLESVALDHETPTPVREAAERLRARVSADFQSASVHPSDDATIIIGFMRSLIQREDHSHR